MEQFIEKDFNNFKYQCTFFDLYTSIETLSGTALELKFLESPKSYDLIDIVKQRKSIEINLPDLGSHASNTLIRLIIQDTISKQVSDLT